MPCPFCAHANSAVTDSRTFDGGIRRRRQCLGCQGRFTTYERVGPHDAKTLSPEKLALWARELAQFARDLDLRAQVMAAEAERIGCLDGIDLRP